MLTCSKFNDVENLDAYPMFITECYPLDPKGACAILSGKNSVSFKGAKLSLKVLVFGLLAYYFWKVIGRLGKLSLGKIVGWFFMWVKKVLGF